MKHRNSDPDLFGEHAGFDAPPDSDVSSVTLTLVVHSESELSIRVSETGEGRIISLPRKEIEIVPTGRRTNTIGKPKLSICTISMPEWLAKNEGLI